MMSKQETIELLRYPIYKVVVRLLFYPYVELGYDIQIVGSERVNQHKPSIEGTLFNYIHTEESIHKGIFDRGYEEYYLQIKDDEVYEVSRDIINGLGSIVDISTTPVFLGLTDKGLYKIG